MKVPGTTYLATVGVVLIGFWPMTLAAKNQQSEGKKSWEFKAQRGTVRIDLLTDVSRPQAPSLTISYGDSPQPSLSEEAGFIRQVLEQLSALGVDPGKLGAVHMRGFAEPEVRQRLATAALHSRAWRSRATSVGGAERVVEDLMNSVGAYDEFNAAFKDYGLRVKVTGVEKVSSDRCLNLKIPDLPCDIHHNPQLPTGANFDLALEAKH